MKTPLRVLDAEIGVQEKLVEAFINLLSNNQKTDKPLLKRIFFDD